MSLPPPHERPQALSVELRVRQPGLDIQAQFRALPGQVCALVGHAGAGKTALLQAAAGLRPAQSGRVALGHHPLYDSAARVNLPAHQRRLGWLDAHTHLLPHRHAAGNLQQALKLSSAPDSARRLQDTIAWLDLEPLLKQPVHRLHAGQRLRVALARTLLASPHAVLMDDPLGLVPEAERPPLLDLLAQVPQRCRVPVVLITPRMSEVIRMADDVTILHEGRTASAGTASHILSDVSLSTFLEGQHAGSVLAGTVARHDIEWLLSEIDIGGQRITVPASPQPPGSAVRLKIRARDVAIHRQAVDDTSTSNHLRGRISQIMLAGEHGAYGAVTVSLDHPRLAVEPDARPAPQVWALLTRRAIQQMGLAPGQDCVVSFKAMAVSVSGWRQA